MKPMITLLTVGIISLAITFAIGKRHFDGVVEDQTFEASLKYDETIKNIKKMEKALGTITTTRSNNGALTITIAFDPSNTDFPNAQIKTVKLVKPVGSNQDYILEKTDLGYLLSENIQPGWYHLKLLTLERDNYVTITKSLYID